MSTTTPNKKDTTIPLTVTPPTSIPFNRIPNTKSHNHPAKVSAKKVLITFSKFVANVRMRDRIVKIIQYGCQMILGYYSIQLSDSIKSGLTETRRFSSNARKAFWLLKSFSHINSCVSLYENGILQNEYLADKLDFGEQIFLMIYFALENIVFFIRSQIITSVAECSIEFYTNASWFGADLCAFISALIRIYDVKQQLKAAKAALLIQDSTTSSRLKNATSSSNKSMTLTDVGRNRQNSTTTGTSSLNYQATFNAFFGLLSSSVAVPQVLNNQRLPSPTKPQQQPIIKRMVSGPNIQNYNNVNSNNSASVVMLKQQQQSALQSAATTTHDSNISSPSITPPPLKTTTTSYSSPTAELNNNGSALTDKEDDDEEDDSEEEKDGEKTIKVASTTTSNINSSSSLSSSYKDNVGLTLTQDKYPFEPEVDAVVAALGESDVDSNNSNNNDDDDERTIVSNSTEHEYHLLRQETEKLNEIARLTKKHSDLELTVAINFFELTVSTHYMSFYKMMLGRDINDGHVGLLGVTSSVLILYEGFKNYHEDD